DVEHEVFDFPERLAHVVENGAAFQRRSRQHVAHSITPALGSFPCGASCMPPGSKCFQSSSGAERARLIRLRRALSSSRLARAAFVGFVGLRGFGLISARPTSSCNRSSAASLFFSWLRNCCALMTTTPAEEMR